MNTYLVAGAAGFIGSRVCQFLLNGGHKVIGVDNFDPAYDLRLKKWRLKKFFDHDAFIFYKEDIRNRDFLNKTCLKCAGILGSTNLSSPQLQVSMVRMPLSRHQKMLKPVSLCSLMLQAKKQRRLFATAIIFYMDWILLY